MGISTAPAAVRPNRRDGEETSDHDLVACVRRGDDRSFEQLYSRYHRRIASYIQGMVHDHARAEDITQDVFMSALRRMRETDRPIAFKPWIYEIAKNACIDQFRRSRRAEEVSYDADEGLGSADYGRLTTKDPAPEAAFETKQQLDQLCGAFGGLSETHHEILVMRELEGLSYREIGEKLGMTRPAVESTLFRARRRLTEEYEQLVTGERCQRVQAIIADLGPDGALGARDRKRVARHVSYCQPCLRAARLSGMDADELVHKPIRAKIAALLPLPAFLKERLGVAPTGDAHASVASWSMQLGSVDPGLVSGWGKAAATAATIVVAGVGASVATQTPSGAASALGGPAFIGVGSGDDGEKQLATAAGGAAAAKGSGSGASGTSSIAARRGGSSATAPARRGSGSGSNAAARPNVRGSGGSGTDAGAVTVGGASGGSDASKPAAKAPESGAPGTLPPVGGAPNPSAPEQPSAPNPLPAIEVPATPPVGGAPTAPDPTGGEVGGGDGGGLGDIGGAAGKSAAEAGETIKDALGQ